MPLKARIYLWFILTLGGSLSYFYFPGVFFLSQNITVITVLAVFAFLAEVYEIEILPQQEISVSTSIYLSAIFIGGVKLGVTVALPAIFISELFVRSGNLKIKDLNSFLRLFQRIAFNTTQILLSVISAAVVFKFIGGHTPPFLNLVDYAPPFAAFSVYTLLNLSLVAGIISLSQGKSFPYQMKFNLGKLRIQVFSLWALSILIAVVYESSPWNLALIAVVLFLVHYSLENYVKLRRQAKQTFEKIMDLLGKRDPYTHRHSESVGDLTEEIVKEMDIKPGIMEDIVSAARVHDIGKLGIPDSILLKEDGLTEEEWETMKEHPVVGADILSGLTIYDDAVDIVRYEHERWDGSGYPEGLEKEDIPLGSRVVAVADVWNALRTKRPYRGPLSIEESKEEIKEMAGVKLDPEVVDALLTVVEEGRAEVKN